MREGLEVLLTAVVVTVVAPSIVAFWQNRYRRQEKDQDWERQDAQEARADARAAETARLLLEANERVAQAAAANGERLDVIHDFVNSDRTETKRSQLVALKGQAVLMERVIALNEDAGRPATAEQVAALEAVRALAAEVQLVVGERLQQQKAIDDAARGQMIE